jgi:aspartyl-tRNA(Asn)/glutamyl-tRNA(Gln) amidotransferase subunit C
MALSLDEVKRIAALARLRLTPQEEILYASQLSRIVDYVDQIRALEGVDSPDEGLEGREGGAARADRVVDGLSRDLALAGAPEHDGEFVVVPQVLRGASKDGGAPKGGR